MIFQTQGLNQYLLHLQAGSLPLAPPGKPQIIPPEKNKNYARDAYYQIPMGKKAGGMRNTGTFCGFKYLQWMAPSHTASFQVGTMHNFQELNLLLCLEPQKNSS